MKMKDAARNLLRWNLKGQATGAIAKRGIYIRQKTESGPCYACKIGLVMLGRWARDAVVGSDGVEVVAKVREIKQYGPRVACPDAQCYLNLANGWPKMFLGQLIEHLFESHHWSVMRIDKWLAEKAELDLTKEREKAGA